MKIRDISDVIGWSKERITYYRRKYGISKQYDRFTPEDDEIIKTHTLDEAEAIITRKSRKQIIERRCYLFSGWYIKKGRRV